MKHSKTDQHRNSCNNIEKSPPTLSHQNDVTIIDVTIITVTKVVLMKTHKTSFIVTAQEFTVTFPTTLIIFP